MTEQDLVRPGTEIGDIYWMRRAIEMARHCPMSVGAYSVGAVLVSVEGREISNGYSRETDEKVHAEESALIKVTQSDGRLPESTIYSTLEPCSQRASRPHPCTQLILRYGISRVVIAWREPTLFVENCVGVELLQENGVEVIELSHLAGEAMSMNRHLSI